MLEITSPLPVNKSLSPQPDWCVASIEEGWGQKPMQWSVASIWRAKLLFIILPRWLFCLGRFGRIGLIHPFLSNCPRQNSYSAARNVAPKYVDVTTFALASVPILLIWVPGIFLFLLKFQSQGVFPLCLKGQ